MPSLPWSEKRRTTPTGPTKEKRCRRIQSDRDEKAAFDGIHKRKRAKKIPT
jgi:hypothetical protein